MPAKIHFTQEQINDVLAMYSQKISAQIIAKKYNVSHTKIINLLHENGVRCKNNHLSKEIEKKICELYEIYNNQEEVAKIVGTTGVSVGRVLRRNKVEINTRCRQKYTLDEKYFDEINTKQKAYILGLLCADGSISSNNYSIHLSLQEKDVHILRDINNELNSNRPLYFIDMKSRKITYQNQYCLTIVNKHMWQTLINLGVVPNKSLKLEFPNISKEYYKSFILGYIDGDGCIHETSYKVGILGTHNIVNNINNYIDEQLDINGNIYDVCSNNITKNLEIYGKNKVSIFLDWLYKDEPLYLKRKHQIFIDKYVNKSLAA